MNDDARFPEILLPRSEPPSPRDLWSPPESPPPEPSPFRWKLNALLFVATAVSVFQAGAPGVPVSSWREWVQVLLSGWTFAVPLLAILLCHEFGHYIAARLHRVDASLPYFLPTPGLSPFGTMGAVIAMRGRIRSRNALLDIGASGPLAGLVVAIPVLVVGLSLSPVAPSGAGGEHYIQEGQSLLYMMLKRLVVGPIPPGQDVQLHPTALAGWVGLLLTMLNLLPWGQLDGGHVAYALLGSGHHRIARAFRSLLLPLFAYNALHFMLPVALGRSGLGWGIAFLNSLFWLVWFLVLGGIGRLSGGGEHPPTDPSELSPKRRVIAVLTLLLFVLLFMPTPWATY